MAVSRYVYGKKGAGAVLDSIPDHRFEAIGAPLVGETLTATLQQGAAVFLSAASTATDAQGEARFRLQVTQSDTDLVVEVEAPATGALLAAVSFDRPDGPSDLGRLNPATGLLTRLGPTGFRLLLGVKFDPAFRTLYTITGFRVPPVLVSLDPATGKATPIAQTNLPTRAKSLAFTADGSLVVGGDDGNLYELDPVTGASTLIGPTGVEVVSGMSLRVLR
jgi:hypothetical protein